MSKTAQRESCPHPTRRGPSRTGKSVAGWRNGRLLGVHFRACRCALWNNKCTWNRCAGFRNAVETWTRPRERSLSVRHLCTVLPCAVSTRDVRGAGPQLRVLLLFLAVCFAREKSTPKRFCALRARKKACQKILRASRANFPHPKMS